MDIIEGTAVEIVPEVRAVAVVPPQTQVILGAAALALMSDDEFDGNLKALEVARKRADQIKKALMVDGTDYGKVPGVDRPFLFKSGAETLDGAFGLVPEFVIVRVAGDGVENPPYSFHAHSLIHLGSKDGPIVGEGFGTCNPWESRYRYRKAERECPNCGKSAVIKGKAEYGGGWLCWPKKDGCNSKWKDGDPAIEGQSTGQVDNPDPWDLENTIAKMAEKRAHVDGTIRATRTSGLFTQDIDSPAVPNTPTPGTPPPAASPAPAVSPGGGGILWRGPVSKGQAPVDGSLRETTDGPAFGFVVMDQSGKRVQVLGTGDFAHALSVACADGLPAEAEVDGDLVMVPWDKKQPDGSMKAMPPYRRVIARRIDTPEWTLSADSVAPSAPQRTDDDLDGLEF